MASKLQGTLAKAALVGATGAVLSVLVLNGLAPVPIMGMMLPKAVAQGLVLSASSVAASYVVPAVTPFVSAGSPQLQQFESLVVTPLVLDTISLALESFVAPGAEVIGTGGTFRTIMVGSAASVVASYTSVGLGWSASEI